MASERLESKFRTDVKKMSDEELGLELKRLQDELFTLRSQAVTEKVENVAKFGMVRRNIARVQTERSARAARSAPAAPEKAAGVKARAGSAGGGSAKGAGAGKKKTTKKTAKATA
jgi:large subunit ribosomal protein L29